MLMLMLPATAKARPDDISPVIWAETKREDHKRPPPPAEVLPAVVEVVEIVEEEPCPVSHIQGKIFWAPVWCIQRALTIIPVEPGQELFCKRGYFGPDDEYAIVSAIPGEDKVDGWARCEEVE